MTFNDFLILPNALFTLLLDGDTRGFLIDATTEGVGRLSYESYDYFQGSIMTFNFFYFENLEALFSRVQWDLDL